MNKTISININGLIFNIEETAYGRLKDYLDTIRKYLNNSEGSDEVIADIESRIGELFMENINDRKEVINKDDVDRVVGIMGKPEDYLDGEMDEPTYSHSNSNRKRKRLFRDDDNKIVSGVCAGISNYFGWDPVWLRILVVVLFLFGGFGLLTYIILWIVIPKAETTAEKIQMHGEPVTVENIKKVVDDGIDAILGNADSHSSRNRSEGLKNGISNLIDGVITIFKMLFKILGKLIGIAFLIVGMIVLVSLLIFLVDPATINFDSNSIGDAISLGDLKELFIGDSSHGSLLTLGILMTIIAPLTALIFAGLKLAFRFRTNSKALSWGLAIVFIIGVSLAATSALRLNQELVRHEIKHDVSQISMNEKVIKLESNVVKGDHYYHNGNSLFVEKDKDNISMWLVGFTIEQNLTDSIAKIDIVRSCKGSDEQNAKRRIDGIEYNWKEEDDRLIFDPYLTFDKDDVFRDQRVKIILKLPVGQQVYIDPSIKYMLDNVPNVSDTWDNDMVDETWLMTNEGLKCLSCDEQAI